jgi:predicted GNAT family N-acyltransferase
VNAIKVKSVDDFKKVVALRKATLHPNGPWELVHYSFDSFEDSFHLAIFDHNSDKVIACGTLLMEDESEEHSSTVARIRGMAVDGAFQGQGLGGVILDGIIEESHKRRVEKIWCNARSKILDFYIRKGFVSLGSEFITAGGVPHYKLVKTITYKDDLK